MRKIRCYPEKFEACLAQKANYEAIFNSMSDGLFVINNDSIITECNKAFTKITGFTQNEVLNRNFKEVFCQEPICGLNIAVVKTIKTGKSSRDEPIEIIKKDGSKIPALFSTSILRNQGGKNIGIIVLLRDVTQVSELQKKLEDRYHFHNLIGKNHRMQEIYGLIEEVAESDVTVLIQGESGTGKELVANAIHYQSSRSGGPFVTVSCVALAESLLESELFGHVKGAFTGAHRDRAGRFELANKGTIFLDEIGEVGPAVQVKLLRVLQEKEIERVGDYKPIKVDTRIIAATNRDLRQLMNRGKFREDLFYRLNVVSIDLPPLRQRRDDIPILVEHFMEKFKKQYKKRIKGISHEALDILMENDWEGNVRELENAIEHAFIKSHTPMILPQDIPHEVRAAKCLHFPDRQNKETLDYQTLLDTLKESGWNQSKAARKLGVNRITIWRNIKKYHIAIPAE